MIDVSNYSITKLASMALEKPEDFGYWGSEDMFKTWGFSGIDNSHQSFLEESNFEVISKQLMAKYPDDFRIESYKHWLVGQVDRLVCRILIDGNEVTNANITKAFRAAMDWHEKLSDYPVADEDHYSNMEYQAMLDNFVCMSNDILFMTNLEQPDWQEKLFHELQMNMDVELSVDAGAFPKDDEVKMALYNLQLWNPNAVEEWNEWTDQNGLERIPFVKENPNQLKLFED